jgi:uncharacterized protein
MALPQYIKVSQGLARPEQYVGEIDPQLLPRLRLELAARSQALQVTLALARERGGNWLKGELHGSLELECSRCEKVFGWPLDANVELRLVRNDAEAQQVLEEADPYQVEDDRLVVADVVEDEVLLALPMLPRCQQCEQAKADEPEPAPAAKVERPNPFAQLKKELK